MCDVNWTLLSGLIAALAAAANVLLLVWMIRVTIRYVDVNVSLLDVNRRSLKQLEQQHVALVDRERRPYRNLLQRAVGNLEALAKRDLVGVFENRNPSGWPTTESLLPGDYAAAIQQAMSYDLELYESLRRVQKEVLASATRTLLEMHRLGSSGRATLHPELPQLQADFRAALEPVIDELNAALKKLQNDAASV